MLVVYIAGKFRGANPWEVHRHVCEAEIWAFEVAKKAGCMPLCPHTNSAHFDGTITDQFWLDGTLELLTRCDAVFLTPNWTRSRGSQAEARLALKIGIPVFISLAWLVEWSALRAGSTRCARSIEIEDESEVAVSCALAELAAAE